MGSAMGTAHLSRRWLLWRNIGGKGCLVDLQIIGRHAHEGVLGDELADTTGFDPLELRIKVKPFKLLLGGHNTVNG